MSIASGRSAATSRSGEMIAKNAPDQLVVNGIVGDGTVVSFQIRGGMCEHPIRSKTDASNDERVLGARGEEEIWMLETTIAGSLPKPAWLAKPRMLWAPWELEGEALAEAKRDATLLALKDQEDAGIDIVSDGEQARQHFVQGFLEQIEGVDFARRVTMGIRDNRYEAEVPTVTGLLRRKTTVHRFEAEIARAHTRDRKSVV